MLACCFMEVKSNISIVKSNISIVWCITWNAMKLALLSLYMYVLSPWIVSRFIKFVSYASLE
jgi:hypothetical protein